MIQLDLSQKLVMLAKSFDEYGIGYALGGALALAFHVQEPRATRDIDINIFLPPEQAVRVLDVLSNFVTIADQTLVEIETVGQTRLLWDDTPLDLFFSVDSFHDRVAERRQTMEFMGQSVYVLSGEDLAVFKVLFNRTRDWADIESMVEVEAIDLHQVMGWIIDILGVGDERLSRLRELTKPRL